MSNITSYDMHQLSYYLYDGENWICLWVSSNPADYHMSVSIGGENINFKYSFLNGSEITLD